MALVEEAEQYGGANEVVVVMHQSLLVFGGDKCQTPGGLNKEAEGADLARQKLLCRQHGLRMESTQLQPTQLANKLRAMITKSNSPMAGMLHSVLAGKEEHESLFCEKQEVALVKMAEAFPQLRCLQGHKGVYLNFQGSVVRAAVVLLATVQDDSFFSLSRAKTNLESAGAGEHNSHLMLPTNASVSPLTYSAVVAPRYVSLCRRRKQEWCIGTFARGRTPGMPSGFHTVLRNAQESDIIRDLQ